MQFSNWPEQIFYYTRCIMPKHVTSWQGNLRVIAPIGNTAPFEEMLQQWLVVGNNVSDFTSLRFEPQTSHPRDEQVTAQPTGWFSQGSFLKGIEVCVEGVWIRDGTDQDFLDLTGIFTEGFCSLFNVSNKKFSKGGDIGWGVKICDFGQWSQKKKQKKSFIFCNND